jgi:hypothetical protein
MPLDPDHPSYSQPPETRPYPDPCDHCENEDATDECPSCHRLLCPWCLPKLLAHAPDCTAKSFWPAPEAA